MSPEPSVVRTLRVMTLIQTNPGIDAATLATLLGVTDRAIRRHVDALRQAGLSIHSTPGLGGGYRIARGVRTPLLFSQEELVGLAMALSEVPGGVAEAPARSAVAKILGVLPARVAGAAQAVLDAAIPISDGGAARPGAAQVLELVHAIDGTRTVEIAYRRAGQEEASTRTVEPWALLVRHRRWYLLALNSETRSVRTYRVDRITDVRVTETRFERPADLDPTYEFEHHLQTTWTHPTEVDIHAPLADARRWIPFTMGELTPLTAGTCRLTGRTNNCKAYILDLAHTPYDFTVLGSADLRIAAQQLVQRVSVPSADSINVPGQYS